MLTMFCRMDNGMEKDSDAPYIDFRIIIDTLKIVEDNLNHVKCSRAESLQSLHVQLPEVVMLTFSIIACCEKCQSSERRTLLSQRRISPA